MFPSDIRTLSEWKELVWENPEYNPTIDPLRIAASRGVPSDRNRHSVRDSLVIHRYAGGYTKEFVVYFDYVKVNYDLSISPKTKGRIGPENDEEAWGYQTEMFKKQAEKTLQFAGKHLRLYEDEKARKGNNFVEDKDFIKKGKGITEDNATTGNQ